MNELFDVLFPKPISPAFYGSMVFIFFTIHFTFVLLTLGGAFFSILALFRRDDSNDPPGESSTRNFKSMFPLYFISKSLAINFGVAVLLFVVVFRTIPFGSSAALNAPVWISLTALIVAAFICLELFDRKLSVNKRKALPLGLTGFFLLLLVPAVFVAFVVTAENPDQWASVFKAGFLFSNLSWHWLVRLLHVLGAAVVITAMFFLIFPVRSFVTRSVSINVLFAALLFQILIGIMLYMTLPSKPGTWTNIFILLGAASALGFAWHVFTVKTNKTAGRNQWILFALMILLPMLLGRHLMQSSVFRPFYQRLNQNAGEYKNILRKNPVKGENLFVAEEYDNYNMPQFIYHKGCEFCHGAVGNGDGDEADELKIPPFDLTTIRTDEGMLLGVLREGIPGTAMPPFNFYTQTTLSRLTGYLRNQVGILSYPEPVPVFISADEIEKAASDFRLHCASCHGENGRVSPRGAAMRPAPRDMTRWTLSPNAAFRIISSGYQGTTMRAYSYLPEKDRWAMVQFLQDLYHYQDQ